MPLHKTPITVLLKTQNNGFSSTGSVGLRDSFWEIQFVGILSNLILIEEWTWLFTLQNNVNDFTFTTV